MTDLSQLKFFATPPHACSYLEDERATTLFVDPAARIDPPLYSALSQLGFRRSGRHLYRPHCQACNACIPVRVRIEDFTPSRSQRRVERRNAGLTVTSAPPRLSDESYALYARYIEARHADGDMYPPSPDQFASFLFSDWSDTRFLSFRDDGRLVAVAVVDLVADGLSAIYTFYDPDEDARSLGRYAILWQLADARRRGLPHLYLGYWIKQCRKMNYKTDFRPLEMFLGERWVQVD